MATFDQHAQQVETQYNAEHITVYAQATPRPMNPQVLATAVQRLAALPLETIPDPALLPEGSRLPFSRNPLFVGREADLRHLAQMLRGSRITAIGQVVAATGLGGLGKTQLAVEFVHRYGSYFMGGVFWLNCTTPEAIPHEVAACGGAGGMQLRPDFHVLPLEEQVNAVRRAWQSPLPRLLVFDNCEDQRLITQWRPTSGGCRVLVTSRRASWEAALGIVTLALDVLPRPESIMLLRQFLPELALSDPDLDGIAAELGDLPLALHLAGSFLARYRQAVSPTAYLAQLRQPDLLDHPSLRGWQLTRDLSPTRHEQHVARTFALSYDRLDPNDPTDILARALLARAAYFAPGHPIPRDLLLATAAGAEKTPDAALQAEDALGLLLDLGLLEPDGARSVRLHRLLAVFVRARTHDTEVQTAVEDVLLAEAESLCDAGYPGPLLPLHPRLRAVTEAAPLREDARTARLHTALGGVLQMIGDYAAAESLHQRALALYEQVLGAEHPNVARSLNNLAELYRIQGRYGAAEPLYQRALAIREQSLEPQHSDVAASLNNLGVLYYEQGRYGAAEPLYQRALAIVGQTLGAEHPDVATSLNNLALLYKAQERYTAAEALLQRALTIHEQSLGSSHPEIATILNNLAELYRLQGQYAEAEPLYRQALSILEQSLGPTHPDVALSCNNLALLYQAQGCYAEAEILHQHALTIREQRLGLNHPDVVVTLKHYLALLKAMQREADAVQLEQRLLAMQTGSPTRSPSTT
jgi:tetratricopeptide (TPR) repeat protein